MSGPPDKTTADVTRLLECARSGDSKAAADLLPIVYDQLRALAASYFGASNPSHTLQPTALVHEAYMKLVRSPTQEWEGRRHFFSVAAKAMRQILANHARDKRAVKRGGGATDATLVTLHSASRDGRGSVSIVDAMALEEALARLEKIDPEQCRIVELRYFAGLKVDETAAVLGVSERTVKREWRMAKAELRVLLGEAPASKDADDEG